MTQWVETPEGGRDRGPFEVVRAWVEVLLRPRRFFENGIAPGDQAPGLVFAVAVALCHVGVRLALEPDPLPGVEGRPTGLLVFAFLVAALILAPLALHLAAALQTLVFLGLGALGLAKDRGGVSQTVQVVAYATAPCALSGAPIPALRVAAAAYGFVLLVVGLAVVHDLSPVVALVAALVPGAFVFAYAFGGVFALESLLGTNLVGPVANATNASSPSISNAVTETNAWAGVSAVFSVPDT
ncbi:YIP1 family protein [Halomarina salina]|uniref:YIP1 family protein n=1 Tax=Halomarina salina TaxID=1872699 RepID=A0ABD5RR89_9EURY